MCNLHQMTMTHAPRQKFGYLDIKQSSKVRPRKLKNWRRRWVVLTQLSNISSDEYVAKLDLYDSEQKWRSNSSDKETFVLENVTSIKSTPSRTHSHAFEVVEKQPVLVISGSSELDSFSWILALQQIFTPDQIPTPKGYYKVDVVANEYSSQWNLSGEFILSVTPTCVSLEDSEGASVISWALSTIMKFKVDKHPVTGQMTVLVIESGPNAPTGQSVFKFQSGEAQDILCVIKQSVCNAQTQMQQPRSGLSPRSSKLRGSVSESGIHNLLDDHRVFPANQLLRSASESSNPTVNHRSSTTPKEDSYSPFSPLARGYFNKDLGLLAEAEENMQVDNTQLEEKAKWAHNIMTNGEINEQECTRSCLRPIRTLRSNSDYSEIKDVASKESRRNSFTCESSEQDFERLRSVSAVVAMLKTGCDKKPRRTVSFENDTDNKSDFDSAISSMILSVANDDIPGTDMQCCKDLDSAKGCSQLLLDRKKSSSTPDLHAHWERLGEVSGFENVYEDLDEIRSSLRQRYRKQDSDTPPALPARPLSLSFNFNNNHIPKRKTSLQNRKSIFKRNEKCTSTEIKHCASRCESMRNQKTCSQSNNAQSSVLEDEKFTQKTKSGIRKNSKQELLGGSCWYIDDLNNRIIPELQQVKRRSSEVNNLYNGDVHTTDAVSSKTNSLPTYGQDSHRWPIPISNNNIKNNNHCKTNPEMRAAALRPVLKSSKNKSSNPLMSFFLDDANFESHPMVTGKLPNHSRSLSSNLNLLTSDSLLTHAPQMPESTSSQSNQEPRLNKLHPELSNNRLLRSPSNTSLDTWTKDEVKNQHNSFSRDTCISPIYANIFPFDSTISSEYKGHHRSYENINFHDNYMAMQAKSERSSYCMKNNYTETMDNFAFSSCELGHLTIGKQVEDIYVHSNVMPLLLI